jgi:hypothetical protein
MQPDRLFVVPGNHDMNRSWVDKMLPTALQKPFAEDAPVQAWLTDDRMLARALEPFEYYSTFIANYTGQAQPAYASMRLLEVGCIQVGLLGLNSAWMCARNKDADGNVNDRGFLVIGEPDP